MTKTLILNTYDGTPIRFEVDDVEEILSAIQYTVSGDECMLITYTNGDYVQLDADLEHKRLINHGPEDVEILLPEDIEWERGSHEA